MAIDTFLVKFELRNLSYYLILSNDSGLICNSWLRKSNTARHWQGGSSNQIILVCSGTDVMSLWVKVVFSVPIGSAVTVTITIKLTPDHRQAIL